MRARHSADIDSRPTARTRLGTVCLVVLLLGTVVEVRGAEPRVDPGFPYVDVNCDGVFDPAVDIGEETGLDVLAIMVTTGSFDTPHCLVVPRGTRVQPTVACLELTAAVDLTFVGKANVGDCLSLLAGRRLVADRASLSAGGNVTLRAGEEAGPDRVLSAASAKIRSRAGTVDLVALQEVRIASVDIRALDSVLIATENLTLNDTGFGPGGIDAAKATIKSKDGEVAVESDFDYHDFPATERDAVAVNLSGARLTAVNVQVIAFGAGIHVDDARVVAARDEVITLDSAGGLVAMDRAKITRAGFLNVMTWTEPANPLQQSRILARGARLRPHGAALFNSGGCGGTFEGPNEILASNMTLVAGDGVDLEVWSLGDVGYIDVSDAKLSVPDGSDLNVSILDDSPLSTIDARGAQIRDPLLPTFYAENVLGDPTPNAPDLAFDANGLALIQLTESLLRVDWIIVNHGPREVPPGAEIAFYRSSDALLDSGDAELGRVTAASAVPGRGGEAAGSVELSVTPGQLGFVIGVVDPSDAVAELNEANNETSARRPGVDLSFRTNGIAIHMTSATEGVVDWTVVNAGDLEAPAGIAITFHLSSDRILDDGDTLLATRTLVAPLPEASTLDGSESFHGLPPEELFFIIATLDPSDAILELSETNNQQSDGIGPNLVVEHVLARYSSAAHTLAITYRIRNEGERAAVGTIEAGFTLFTQYGHMPVESAAFETLAAGAAHEETVERPVASLPSFAILFATTDAAQTIAEADEFDNTLAVGVIHIP